jgi:copper(I)-binding protein
VNSLRIGTLILAAGLIGVPLTGCSHGTTPTSPPASPPAAPTATADPAPAGAAVSVTGAEVRVPTVPDVTAGYLKITNTGPADTLTGVRSTAAAKVEMHRMLVKGGTMTMERMDSVPVPAGGTVEFSRGATHLMLMNPRTLQVGERVPLTLHFATAGDVTISAEVVPVAGSGR